MSAEKHSNELVVGGVVDVMDDGSHLSPLSIMSRKKNKYGSKCKIETFNTKDDTER